MTGAGAHLLAIDVGTTTTRCALFDLQGKPVAEAFREPPVHHPHPNWCEVDPEDYQSVFFRAQSIEAQGRHDEALAA